MSPTRSISKIPLKQDVLNAFLADAWRLLQKATECVKELTRQSVRGELNSELVRTFYHHIHALKGTASMIEGGAPIVDALQSLEAQLSCQTLAESARKPTWLTLARQSFQKTELALRKLQSETKTDIVRHNPVIKQHSSRGLLAKADLLGEKLLVWFPMESLLHVFTPNELAFRSVLCVRGAWTPVFGVQENSDEELGIGIKTEIGSAVIIIKEVLGMAHWSDALREGATSAPDLLSRLSKQNVA